MNSWHIERELFDKQGLPETYINVGDQFYRLAILSELLRLDVLENGHAMTACQTSIKRACRETARAKTVFALLARLASIFCCRATFGVAHLKLFLPVRFKKFWTSFLRCFFIEFVLQLLVMLLKAVS